MRSLLCYVLTATTQIPPASFKLIEGFFDDLYKAGIGILPSEIAESALVVGSSPVSSPAHQCQLLWKRIDHYFNSGQHESVIDWCKLGQHTLLDKRSDINANILDGFVKIPLKVSTDRVAANWSSRISSCPTMINARNILVCFADGGALVL